MWFSMEWRAGFWRTPGTMSDPVWDARLKSFLKKTGEDFKRFSNEVKVEADKLLAEVKDPQRQQRVKEGLEDVGQWARRTAEELSTVVEDGLKKAEQALAKASRGVTDFVTRPTVPDPEAPGTAPAPMPSRPPPAAARPAAPARAQKSVGPRPRGKSSAAPRRPVKKTVGKRAPGSGRPSR